MVEFKSNYSFAGVLIALAIIVSGTTYSLTPTGNYKVCDNGVGWQLDQNTGQYTCGDRKYDCSAVRSTKTGKSNYYCDGATRIEVKETIQVVETQSQVVCPKVKVLKYGCEGEKYICDDLGQNCHMWDSLMSTGFQ